jgi:pantoate--beta-alanine ligase
VREVASSAELRAATDAARTEGAGVGFVPTMGALHAGHRSLLAAARRENALVVASVFVNPLQFGPAEDLASYPRDRGADLAVLAAEGTDLAFLPSDAEMWPTPPEVRVQVGGGLAERLEGQHRPGHLDGVATVVAKLLHLVGPSRAYFGQKDAQQLAMIRRMVADLAFPNQVVACPTVREPDGLAVSSRNAYLSPDERRRATALHRALEAGRAAFRAGGDPAAVEAAARDLLEGTPGVEPDYVALVEEATFEPVKQAEPGQVLATAARVGRSRLIDNVILE